MQHSQTDVPSKDAQTVHYYPPNTTKLAISAGCWLQSPPGLHEIFAEWIQWPLSSFFSHSGSGHTRKKALELIA